MFPRVYMNTLYVPTQCVWTLLSFIVHMQNNFVGFCNNSKNNPNLGCSNTTSPILNSQCVCAYVSLVCNMFVRVCVCVCVLCV